MLRFSKKVRNLDLYVKFTNLKNIMQPEHAQRPEWVNTFPVQPLLERTSRQFNEDIAAKLLPAYFPVPNIWSFVFPTIPTPYTHDYLTFSEVPTFVHTRLTLSKFLVPVEILCIVQQPAQGRLWIAQVDHAAPKLTLLKRYHRIEYSPFFLTFSFFLLSPLLDYDLFQSRAMSDSNSHPCRASSADIRVPFHTEAHEERPCGIFGKEDEVQSLTSLGIQLCCAPPFLSLSFLICEVGLRMLTLAE